jgi:hypothetical protein
VSWKVYDFRCDKCGGVDHDKLINTNDPETYACDRHLAFESYGTACNGRMCRTVGASGAIVTIVKGNHDYNERERARLEKRSHEHFLKHGRDEAIYRERKQMGREK